MEHACATITICFEEPFWIALYERIEAGHCTVCKITFGAEPKDYEVYQFLLDHWRHLPFSPPVPVEQGERKRLNPKRAQREIKKQLQHVGIGTKAQQALKLSRKRASRLGKSVPGRRRKQNRNADSLSARKSARRSTEGTDCSKNSVGITPTLFFMRFYWVLQ